jgi:pSer/pThr/pTyr-binding forkhead associated (FHA) protein
MHCILVKTDGLVYMRDLGSTNGTRVNGQRVLRGALLPGDQISFSGSAFRVHLAPDSARTGDESDVAAPIAEIVSDQDPGTSSDVVLLSDDDLLSDRE